MAGHRVKGAKQLSAELPAALVDAFRAWVQARGEKVSAALELAIRRHMEYPPPPPVVPAFPVEEPTPSSKKPRRRRA